MKTTSEKLTEIINHLLATLETGDITEIQETTKYICENFAFNQLDSYFLGCFENALCSFILFGEIGVGYGPDGTPHREYFRRIISFLVDNKTEDFAQFLKEAFPETENMSLEEMKAAIKKHEAGLPTGPVTIN